MSIGIGLITSEFTAAIWNKNNRMNKKSKKHTIYAEMIKNGSETWIGKENAIKAPF